MVITSAPAIIRDGIIPLIRNTKHNIYIYKCISNGRDDDVSVSVSDCT